MSVELWIMIVLFSINISEFLRFKRKSQPVPVTFIQSHNFSLSSPFLAQYNVFFFIWSGVVFVMLCKRALNLELKRNQHSENELKCVCSVLVNPTNGAKTVVCRYFVERTLLCST